MDVHKIAMNPWDFTLYESNDGQLILKVVFSEGDYKTDIGRFFILDSLSNEDRSIDKLKELAVQIRSSYPDVALQQISKADIAIVK